MTPFLTAALAAIERGYTVFPIRDKQPLTRFVNGNPLTSLATGIGQAENLDRRFPRATGAGIKLPATAGVFDCDTSAARNWCLRNLPETYTVTTGRPGGGAHYYVALSSRLRHNPRMPVPGLEFKTLGGYVVAPGSLHESGATYEVERDVQVQDIPRALAKKIGPPRPSQDDEATAEELAAWENAAKLPSGPFYGMAQQLSKEAIIDADQWLRRWLPEGDEWGNKFFGQAAHLGRWVGAGLLEFDTMEEFLWAIFQELDDGRGGSKGEQHVRRSIRRGLAAGARSAST